MATKLKIFSLKWYLDHNPDVAAAVAQGLVDAFEHFENYGKIEGRSMGPLFDVELYLEQNTDVAEAVARGETTAYDHFMQYGAGEDRTPSALFDEAFYLLQNPDVAAAVQAGTMTAVQHFLSYGQSEPRPFNPSIDLGAYLQANPDIAAAVQNGFVSAMEHLMVYGATEGRDLGNGVNLGMFANDNSFQQALAAGDITGALQRVGEVAPFLPTFQPPVGWTPPPDTPIPLDFVPPAGVQLVIPPTVVVPPNVVLPPVFTPPAPPGPTPGGGGGTTGPTFTAELSGGTLTFTGTATGDIIMTVNDGVATFVRGTLTASLKPRVDDIHKLTVGPGMTLQALEDDVSNMKQIDLVDGGLLKVTTKFEKLSATNQAMERADVSKVAVNGMHGPDAIWESVSVTSNAIADKFKLFWATGDEKYYELLYKPNTNEQKAAVNNANLELSVIYATHLKDGGDPIFDVVQTKDGGTANFVTRQQSLHDNLMGNLNRTVINGRVHDEVLSSPQGDSYDDASGLFGGRPYHDGKLSKLANLEKTVAWDLAHGIERNPADVTEISGEAYVIRKVSDGTDLVTKYLSIQAAVNAAQANDVVYVGPGRFDEDINVVVADLHIVLSPDAVIDGGFVVRSSADGFHLSGAGTILDGMGAELISGSSGKGIYVQSGANVTVEGVKFEHTKAPDTGQYRGIEVENGDSVIIVDGASFEGWLSGIYVNGGNVLTVSGSSFLGGPVGIGTDGPAKLDVSDSHFSTSLEGIGLTGNKVIGQLDISGNTYGSTRIAIANNGVDTELDAVQGANVIVVARGQLIQDAVNKLALLLDGAIGQVILGIGEFTGDVALNGNIQLIGQGADVSKIVGGIKINVPSDAGKVVKNVLLQGFTVDPDGNGLIPIIAYSNIDTKYNTDGLKIIGVKIVADGQHGLGLFDVQNALLQNLMIYWESEGASDKYGIEAIGLKDAVLENILMQGFSTNGLSHSMLNIGDVSGYEGNSNIRIIEVSGLQDGSLFSEGLA